ncbi:hypothetical protein NMG60_11018943 [Bertholletia excelsa]
MAHFNPEMNSSMELLKSLGDFESLSSNVQGFVDPQLPANFTDNVHAQSSGPFYDQVTRFLAQGEGSRSGGGKGVKEIYETEVCGAGLVEDDKNKRNYGFGGKKRKRINEREVEKPREVIHVRAKRGQATDSHSLAERLRREKINEKLRSLQDLVPGCYKTMGMAVMLDVIINYVRSLQNQIEFLSMKLSAASLFYDFNSDVDPTDAMQGANGYEIQGMEWMVGKDLEEASLTCHHHGLFKLLFLNLYHFP